MCPRLHPQRASKRLPNTPPNASPTRLQTTPQHASKRLPNAPSNAPPTYPHKNKDKCSFFSVLSCLNKTEPRALFASSWDMTRRTPSRPRPPLSPSACRCTHPPSARRCTHPLCVLLHAPPPRVLARPCTRRRIARARVWGEGEGMCSSNRAVLQVHRDTFAVLRCTRNVARCTRTLNRKGTVFSGTGRGMTHGTRGLPVSRPDGILYKAFACLVPKIRAN
jgi:hypothetical protein